MSLHKPVAGTLRKQQPTGGCSELAPHTRRPFVSGCGTGDTGHSPIFICINHLPVSFCTAFNCIYLTDKNGLKMSVNIFCYIYICYICQYVFFLIDQLVQS